MEVSPSEATYRSLLGMMMQRDSSPLVNAYGAIEELIEEVQKYVKVRVSYLLAQTYMCGC